MSMKKYANFVICMEEYWSPAPLLKQLAEERKSFAQWDKEKSST